MTHTTTTGSSTAAATPESTLAVVHRFYEALATNDGSNIAPLLTEDCVVICSEGMPYDLGGEYHGPWAATNVWVRIWALHDMHAEPMEFLPVGDDRVVVLGFYRGKAKDGSAAVDARFAHVITVRGDRLAAFQQITDTARWVLPTAR